MGRASLTFLGGRVLIICLISLEVTWGECSSNLVVTFNKVVSHKGTLETNMHRGMANAAGTQERLSSVSQGEKTQETH